MQDFDNEKDDNILAQLQKLAGTQPASDFQSQSIPLPNGGMEGQQLADYIKANPGPKATTGFNPSSEAPSADPSLFSRVSNAMQPFAKSVTTPESVESSDSGSSRALANTSDQIKSTQSAPSNMVKGYGQGLDDDALKAAQQQATDKNQLSLIGRAGANIGAALARNKADNSFYDTFDKTADKGVKDILTRRDASDKDVAHQMSLYQLSTEQEKSDPTSSVSKMARDLLQQMATKANIPVNITDNMSVQSLEKVFGPLERYFGMVESSNARKLAMSDKKEQKDKELVMKYNKSMGEDLDPNRARSGALGKSQQVINDTQSLEALSHNYASLDKVPPAQYAEMAAALDRLVSRGNPSIERFKHLMPNNAALTGSNVLQWISSKPQGGNQGAFIQSILNTAQAERKTAQQQILDAQLKKAYSTHNKYKDLSPDDFYNTLSNATGLSIDEVKARENNKDGRQPEGSPSDLVKVMSPEGESYMMPRTNLIKAKSRGFKEIS